MPGAQLAAEFAAEYQHELGVKIKSLPVLSRQPGGQSQSQISPRADNK